MDFDIGTVAKLEQIISYIDDISQIVSNHDGIENALAEKEGEDAITMCIVQIGEVVI